MSEEKKLTGYPSIDKPWLKYYSEEAINAPLPECTMYEYIKNKNGDNSDRIAINYYGNNISYHKFFKQIETVASALENIGIKENDIVTVCMINSPETLLCRQQYTCRSGGVCAYAGNDPPKLLITQKSSDGF